VIAGKTSNLLNLHFTLSYSFSLFSWQLVFRFILSYSFLGSWFSGLFIVPVPTALIQVLVFPFPCGISSVSFSASFTLQ
jgi:hypothetical protein